MEAVGIVRPPATLDRRGGFEVNTNRETHSCHTNARHFPMQLLAVFICSCICVYGLPSSEVEALERFYNETAGAFWTNNFGWFTSEQPCNWNGVYCGAGDMRIRYDEC